MPPRGLGRVLKQRREAKGMSQVSLAEAARVGRTYIVKLESGEKKIPHLTYSRNSQRHSASR
jgi:transcriptional regulator with XRE-family HTH domain